jgi:hypothetical protein
MKGESGEEAVVELELQSHLLVKDIQKTVVGRIHNVKCKIEVLSNHNTYHGRVVYSASITPAPAV